MKTLVITLISVIMVMMDLCAQNPGRLIVEVEGVKENKGLLTISVFNSEETYLNKAIKSISIDLEKENMHRFEIKDLPSGTYAFSVIHDENKNGELDFGMMGPEEDYGFSNNARGLFGPASFEESKFDLKGDLLTKVNIK